MLSQCKKNTKKQNDYMNDDDGGGLFFFVYIHKCKVQRPIGKKYSMKKFIVKKKKTNEESE